MSVIYQNGCLPVGNTVVDTFASQRPAGTRTRERAAGRSVVSGELTFHVVPANVSAFLSSTLYRAVRWLEYALRIPEPRLLSRSYPDSVQAPSLLAGLFNSELSEQ